MSQQSIDCLAIPWQSAAGIASPAPGLEWLSVEVAELIGQPCTIVVPMHRGIAKLAIIITVADATTIPLTTLFLNKLISKQYPFSNITGQEQPSSKGDTKLSHRSPYRMLHSRTIAPVPAMLKNHFFAAT